MTDWDFWILLACIFFIGYSINRRISKLSDELDYTREDIAELCDWLIEIDKRFDGEKQREKEAGDSSDIAALNDMAFAAEQSQKGERTLNDPLRRQWRWKNKRK